ncbi:MAG: hypothetical protein R3D63_13645 [Paracoccaceae bacterium]
MTWRDRGPGPRRSSHAEIEADLPDRDTRFAHNDALRDLGRLQTVPGNTLARWAPMTRSEFAEAQVMGDLSDFRLVANWSGRWNGWARAAVAGAICARPSRA